MSHYVAAALAIVLITLYITRRRQTTGNTVDLNLCQRRIESKHYPSGHTSYLSPLQSRMIPNQRHRIVFGIDNAFTSDDEEYAALFVTKTAKAITMKPECWKNLSTMARRAAQESVGRMVGAGGHDDARVYLTSLIQILTIQVILCVKFGIDVERVLAFPDTCLVDLATAINDTWVASKTTDAKSEMSAFEDNHRL